MYGLDSLDGPASATKNAGNFSDNSRMASSVACARPTYGSDPALGKDPVDTGAFAIKKRTSICLVVPSGKG